MKLIKILMMLALFASFKNTSATHVMGTDMEYYTSSDSLYITLKIYRDCQGVALSNSPIMISGGSQSFNVLPAFKSVSDITGICSSLQSVCSGGSYSPAYEEHIYQAVFYMNIPALSGICELEVSWEQCCRNSTIKTGMANQNFYSSFTYNRCLAPINKSPLFSNVPVILMCRDRYQEINMGMINPDSLNTDSISYSLSNALQGSNNSVTYSGSYSSGRPLDFLGFPNQNAASPSGFHLDPVTGQLSFTPTVVQRAVIVVEVTEWRRISGAMTVIGKSRRDIQVIVLSCTNNNPLLSDLPMKVACPGSYVCFDIVASDTNATDSVFASSNFGLDNANYTITRIDAKTVNINVCWSADPVLPPGPHVFTINAFDNACPVVGTTTKAYAVLLTNPLADFESDIYSGQAPLTIQTTNTSTGNFYKWYVFKDSLVIDSSDEFEPDFTFNDSGTYIVGLISYADSFCNDTTTRLIHVSPALTSHITELNNSEFALFPNPAKDLVEVKMKVPGNYIITITDMAGRNLKTQRINDQKSGNINISDFNPGVYIISVADINSKCNRKKLLIQ